MCVHSNDDAEVHQMFIVHPGGAYVRPHKHNKKHESLLVLEGSADYLLFSEAGKLEDRVELSDFQSGSSFFQITPAGFYHSLIIKTRWLVFIEVTNGPFIRGESTFSPWSPEEGDIANVAEFLGKYTLTE
jgi:cupin fold WbuC family metalloprotein